MGEVMWFLRTNRYHHSLAIARGPHVSLHHASFEMRGIDEYMRGTGRLLRAGVEKVWGPGRHMAGNNTFSYFLDPHGNTIEYTTELEELDEDTWHPHLYDFSDPEVTDQWGTANPMNEFVAKKSFNDPDRGVFVAPAGLRPWCALPPTSTAPAPPRRCGRRRPRARAAGRCDRRDLVRLGLDAALELGAAAATGDGTALSDVRLLAPLRPASVRDFVAFEEHVEGVRRSIDGASGVPEAWYDAPTFYFTNPHALVGPDEDVAFPAAACGPRLRARGGRRRRARGPLARRGDGPRPRLRLHHHERLVGPRPAGPRDAGQPRPGQGQGLRHHAGPMDRHRRRARADRDADGFLDLACRAAVNGDEVGGDLLANMGWTLRGDDRLRLARQPGAGRRRARVRDHAATAAAWRSCGAVAATRTRRRCATATW